VAKYIIKYSIQKQGNCRLTNGASIMDDGWR